MKFKKIFLIGLPGSGKTTIGKELAKILNIPFQDTDDIICRQQGKTIDEIFNMQGESYFRELEREVLHELLTENKSSIISTGGGLPCFFDNIDQINKKGTSIFLNVLPETIVQRLWNQEDHNRPMVKGKSKEELLKFLIEKSNERIQFYSKATLILEGDDISAEKIAGRLNQSLD